MGEQQRPAGPEGGLQYEGSVREETAADQIHNGLTGANERVYVEGEMVRETFLREPVRMEVVPGAEIVAEGATGKIPERRHSTQEDIVVHHAEDVAMHDREVAEQTPILIVES